MNQETARLSSGAAHPVKDKGQSRRGPIPSVSLSSIGGWMLVIAAIAILLAVEIQLTKGVVTCFLVVTILLTLPSHKHFRLVFGRVVKAKPTGSLENASLDSSRAVSKPSLSDKK